MNARQLRTHAETLRRAMRAHLDNRPGRLWTPRDQVRFDAEVAELERVNAQIREAEAKADAAALTAMGATELSLEEHRSMLRNWALSGERGLTDRQRSILNTMSTTTGSQGGFTVSSTVADRFSDFLRAFSAVRSVAETIPTENGSPLGWPSSDGTAETGELLAENAAATSADPTFAQASLASYKFSSKLITAPLELVQDSNIDFEGYVLQRAASRIGRLQNTYFTTGTGSGQPTGFAGAATVGKTGLTGQTLTIIHDDVVDLIHSVDPAYRHNATGGAVFMTSDAGAKMLRKLKDTQGRPLYLPDEQEDAESIMGYPLVCNPDVAVPAANARSVFYGNFYAGYKVRDALQVTLFRFDDSALIVKGQIGFLAIARAGGNLVDTAAIRAYVNSAT